MRQLLVLILAFAVVLPVTAQEEIEEICPGAQAWYDSIDPDQVVQVSLMTVMDGDARVSARFAALDAVNEIIEVVEADESPECVEQAKLWYLDGLSALVDAGEDYIDDDIGGFMVTIMGAMQSIGQFRGYMGAVGVEVVENETAPWHMK